MENGTRWKLEKTFVDSQTDQVVSRELVKEDFDNIQYSALNVNQNRKCDFGADGKIVIDGNQSNNCWKMAKLTDSLDYEATPARARRNFNPFSQNGIIEFSSNDDHPFAVEEDKWVFIEEARKFQNILKKNMQHPVSPAKDFWRKEYEKDLNAFNLRWTTSESGNSTIGNLLQNDKVDTTECEEKHDNAVLAIKQESICPEWGKWMPGKCNANCGFANRKLTRECFKGGKKVAIIECADEYPNDPRDHKSELCDGLPECKMGDWENVGTCSQSCGGGKQVQSRVCTGNSCGTEEAIRSIDCNLEKCQDVWGPWGRWGNCSVTCGGGKQRRDRMMIEGSNRGERDEEEQNCNNHNCPPPPKPAGGGGKSACGDGAFSGSYWENGCFMNSIPFLGKR